MPPRAVSRRALLVGGALAGTGAAMLPVHGARATPMVRDPFTLGVASGDPLPDSVVLWTRLAPRPLDHHGGMPSVPVPVQWEVAEDERFRTVVARGTEITVPSEAHTVHVDVKGLRPHREYYYRFRSGADISPVGRTRTSPAPGTSPSMNFVFASCANYERGLYTAYQHLAEEDPDLVFFLGDYIYENSARDGYPRRHVGDETNTLDEYRQRYAQYKTDPQLQAAHAVAPWAVTWDDHEVDNNYAPGEPTNTTDEGNETPEAWAARRRGAYQAYWEHMPLRRFRKPVDTHLPLYRRLEYGTTARFNIVDSRQYRSHKMPLPNHVSGPIQWQTNMLGDEQHAWLTDSLRHSPAVWNVMPQAIFFASRDGVEGPDAGGLNEGWDGYQASRDKVLGAVEEHQVDNFVVLTGDAHSNNMHDLRRNFEDPDAPLLGSEFIGTSISSGGDGVPQTQPRDLIWAENPHLRYFKDLRGYVRCEVTPDHFVADYRVVDYVTRPGAPIRTDKTFVIEAGNPRAEEL